MYSQNPYGPPSHNSYYGEQQQYQYNPSKFNGSTRNPYSKSYQEYDNFLQKYNDNSYTNVNQTTKHNEDLRTIEFNLDEERKNTKKLRMQMESDIEQERRLRLDFEKNIITLREENQQLENQIQEQDYTIQNLRTERDNLLQENRAMHNDFIRGQEQYNQKLRELEDRCRQLNKQLISNDEKYRLDLDKTNKSYEQRIADMTQAWKIQKSDFESQVNSLNRQVGDLNHDLNNAQNEIMRIRIEAEEEIREAVVRVQDEEMRKYMSHIRNIEQKLKASEEAKDLLMKKNSELIHQNSEKDRIINTKQMEFDQSYSRFKQELSEYQNQLNQANIAREKLRNELMGKDQIIQRIDADFRESQKQGSKTKERHQQEILEIHNSNAAEKAALEQRLDELSKNLKQSEMVKTQMEEEIAILKQNLDDLGGKIQNNVEKSIFQALNQTNLATRYDNRRPFYGQKYQ